MCDFLLGADLWANIIGGVVAALVVAAIFGGKTLYNQFILRKLITIMGQAIKHRNKGKRGEFDDEKLWVDEAKEIEKKATAKAKCLSSSAGALVQWLDRVPPYPELDQVAKYVSHLDTVIERIRGLLERNS